MKVLITGGAGFIGSHLADRLLADGHEVRAFDNLDPQVHLQGGRPEYLDPEVELQTGDVRDRGAVRRALEGVDAVVHFAAAVGVGQSMYEIERYTSINAIGAAIVLEEAVERRDAIRKLLVASSMSIYGEGQYRNPRTGESGLAPWLRPESQLAAREWELLADDGTPLEPEPTAETKPLRPTSIYAINKRDHEEMFLTVGAAYGLPAVALRFFNVYGERQALSNPYTGVAAIFSSRLLNDRAPLVFEDGRQTRDFIDVRDIARCCALALTEHGADEHALNVGTGSIAPATSGIATPTRALPQSCSASAPRSRSRPACRTCSRGSRARRPRIRWTRRARRWLRAASRVDRSQRLDRQHE